MKLCAEPVRKDIGNRQPPTRACIHFCTPLGTWNRKGIVVSELSCFHAFAKRLKCHKPCTFHQVFHHPLQCLNWQFPFHTGNFVLCRNSSGNTLVHRSFSPSSQEKPHLCPRKLLHVTQCSRQPGTIFGYAGLSHKQLGKLAVCGQHQTRVGFWYHQPKNWQ